MKRNEIFGRKVATVGKDASVLRAAAIMRQHHVHDLVVIERKYGGWAPTGVITEHDIAIEVVGQGLDPRYVTVDTAMTSRLSGVSKGGGNGGGDGEAAGTMPMDAMLTLLVTELNHIGHIGHIGQPMRLGHDADGMRGIS